MTRITVNLTKQELEALIVLAGREIRHPRSQAAFIIRMELQKLGLIEIKNPLLVVTGESIQSAISAGVADDKQE